MPLYNLLEYERFDIATLFSTYLGKTKTEIRRLREQGAIKVWFTDEEPDLTTNRYNLGVCRTTQATECLIEEEDYYVFRVGKRNYFSVTRVMDMVLVVPYNF